MEAREETFRRLYAAHFDAVLGYALRRTDRPEDAADVVSETFVVAWRRIGHVSLDGSLPWLYAGTDRLPVRPRLPLTDLVRSGGAARRGGRDRPDRLARTGHEVAGRRIVTARPACEPCYIPHRM